MNAPQSRWFPVEMNSADGKDMVVRRAKVLMALMLAVLWLPVTMHCALEVLPGLDFLICCDHEGAVPHEDDDCGADACATVESGFYKLQDHEDLLSALSEIVVGHAWIAGDPCLISVSPPPTDLTAGWQFTTRAAPLPRAPSVLL